MQPFGLPPGRDWEIARAFWLLRHSACLLLCAGALAGCGDIAFKRGTGPDAFAADRQACQERNANQDAVHACLSAAGWHIADLEPSTAPASPTQPEKLPMAAVSSSAQPIAAVATSPQTPAPQATPKTLLVGGWWKVGAGSADLQSAAATCVAKLGPANAPDEGYHRVTPALYACLRGQSWHALARPGG